MIPILFEHNETEFLSQGIGRLKDCISNTVTEERNGIFECEFVYPFFSKMYSEITEGRIIYCTHDETEIPQPFDIYAHSAPIDGKVTFYARHITYRQNRMVVMPFSASSVAEAMVKIKANSATTNPFTYWTDKSTTATFELSEPRSIRAVLGGQEGSLLDIFGSGEYEWDKFTVKLHQNRGTDSGVEIRYGKNLVDLTDEIDTGSSYNAVVPYWLPNSDDATIVTLPEKVLVYNGSEFVSIENATISGVVAMDLSSEFQNQPTVSQLRDRAKSMLVSSKAWEARRNISVDFVALWQTEEYKDVAPLQRVRLCDTVSVFYPELGVEAVKQKVVKTVWNVLLDRYDKIELGDSTYSYSEIITEGLFEDVPTTSFMESAINRATNRITGGRGGHIRMNFNADGDPDEILVMDSTDINQAVKLWRWNMGGLGYSEDGYDGPYGTAITMDGEIVADFITVGSLNAGIMTTGILTDKLGKNYWNLDTGAFSLTGYVTDSALQTLQSDLEQQIDGKINTFYQQADPSTNWTAEEKTAHTGDLWFRTTDAKTLRWNGSSWQEQEVSTAVRSAIDSKSTIWYGTTSGTYNGVTEGDYLVDNTNGATYRWNGSSWVKQTDYASAITAYDRSLGQDAVFNKLTNNGASQGIWIDPTTKNLYVNASMIKTGSMDATLIKAGILQSQDSSTNFSLNMLTGEINMKGATLTGGSLTTQNGSYKNVTQNGHTYYYYGDEYIGRVGSSPTADLQSQGMMITIGGDAEFGGFDINEPGSDTSTGSLYYNRSLDIWVVTKPTQIKVDDHLATLSVDSANHLTSNGNKVAYETWVTNTLSTYATQSWVNSQGFLKTADFSQYATQSWVNSQGFLTNGSTAATTYATQQWVTNTAYPGLTSLHSISDPYTTVNPSKITIYFDGTSSTAKKFSSLPSYTGEIGGLAFTLTKGMLTYATKATYATMQGGTSYDAFVRIDSDGRIDLINGSDSHIELTTDGDIYLHADGNTTSAFRLYAVGGRQLYLGKNGFLYNNGDGNWHSVCVSDGNGGYMYAN